MTNVLKKLKCIEWILKTSSNCKTMHISEPFFFLNRTCNLLFYVGYITGFSDNINSYLELKSKGELHGPINFKVCVTSNSSVMSVQSTKSVKGETQAIWNFGNGSTRDLLLTIQVLISVDNFPRDEKSTQTSYADTHFLFENVSKDLSKLLDEGPNYDVQFTCEDQTIEAHKNILCCRSKVFATMLQSDMVEGKTGKVNIKDMNADIFRKFLKSLYTGYLPELTVDTAVEFYKASDKYALNDLKNQCVEFLTDNLNLENACEILILADRHSDADFKKGVMNYIFKEKIPIKGENWTDFCNENQKLAIEVLNLFCQHLHNN